MTLIPPLYEASALPTAPQLQPLKNVVLLNQSLQFLFWISSDRVRKKINRSLVARAGIGSEFSGFGLNWALWIRLRSGSGRARVRLEFPKWVFKPVGLLEDIVKLIVNLVIQLSGVSTKPAGFDPNWAWAFGLCSASQALCPVLRARA